MVALLFDYTKHDSETCVYCNEKILHFYLFVSTKYVKVTVRNEFGIVEVINKECC